MNLMKKSIIVVLCLSLLAVLFAVGAGAGETLVFEVGAGKEYTTIQSAVDAVAALPNPGEPTEYIINVANGEYAESVKIIQQVNKNVNIIGESTDGVIVNAVSTSYYNYRTATFATKTGLAAFLIDGAGGLTNPDTVTIKNFTIKMDADGYAFQLCELYNTTQHYSYCHNITIENCNVINTSTAITVVGIGSSNTTQNLVVKNCELSNLHSFLQISVTLGVTIDGCTLTNCARGVNLASSINVLIKDTDFGTVPKYAIRTGQGSGTGIPTGSLEITGCTGGSTSTESDEGFLVIRCSVPPEITVTNNTVIGKVICTNTNQAELDNLTIDLSENYWGSPEPEFEEILVGFAALPVAATPPSFFLSPERETLNTDCSYVGYHTYDDNWYATVAPTCCAAGIERRDCANERCTDETAFETRVAAATGEHIYSDTYTLITAPNCVAVGEERTYCTTAGCTEFISREIPVSPDAHNMGTWAINIHETCSEVGYNKRFCRNEGCEYFEETERAISPHSYTVVEEVIMQPNCISAGVARYGCTMCELTEIRAYEAPTGQHTWSDWTVTKEATVSEDGSQIRHCTVEGCTGSETQVIPQTGAIGIIDWLISFFNKLTEMLNYLFANLGL